MTAETKLCEIRLRAWDNALHAEGTRDVFSRRFRSLRRRIRFRNWLGFAVPILIGAVATTEWLKTAPYYQNLAFAALVVAGFGQLLFALWSSISKWDDDLAYCMRAIRDSDGLKDAWMLIGRNDVEDIQLEYRMRLLQQQIIDSHDAQHDISNREKQIGMRAGLILLQRNCVSCKMKPSSRKPPLFKKTKCVVCGGN